jgi:glucose/arabinose dehydrogenase
MRRVLCLSVALALVLGAVVVTGGEATASASVTSIGAGLRGPRGLHASRYALHLRHLSALAEDAEGRTWAATAALADTGTDGVYLVPSAGATPVKVIADAHTPLGLLWIGDALYVSEHDTVEVFRGFDGTQFASHATVVSFPDGTGELNGLALGADGRIVLGISAPCNACTTTSEWSASIVSFLPDGSDLRVFAGGIRAAIGLTYYPGTDDLFVTMNQRDDLGAKTPGDWLSVVAAGEQWGFPACFGQGGSVCAGVPAPVASLAEHAAVSGVALVTGQLGASAGTGAVVAEWTTGKVRLVPLTRTGTTYRGTTRSFLSGFSHPMPVFLTTSGALLVGDWGSGTIYRVTG